MKNNLLALILGVFFPIIASVMYSVNTDWLGYLILLVGLVISGKKWWLYLTTALVSQITLIFLFA